jgi:photosystem II stability/assembly factor-like uncharacterized protein
MTHDDLARALIALGLALATGCGTTSSSPPAKTSTTAIAPTTSQSPTSPQTTSPSPATSPATTPPATGTPWQPSLPNAAAAAIAVDPVTPATVYAATAQGVEKTTDAGATWKDASAGLPSTVVSALAIDPSQPSTVFCGSPGGVAKSTDGGATWASVIAGRNVLAIAIDPTTTANVYAGLDDGSIEKSADGGATWARTATGVSAPIVAIAIDPTAPATLYLATGGAQITGPGPGGLLRSTDGGATFTDLMNGLANVWRAVVVDPLTKSVYAASDMVSNPATGASIGLVARSTDGGATWTQLTGFPSGSVAGLVLDPTTAGTLYTFGLGGVLVSVDSGATFADAGDGLIPANIGGIPVTTALAIDPRAPLTLYSSSQMVGIEKTTTGGR